MQRGDVRTGVWSRPIGNSFRLPGRVLVSAYAGTQRPAPPQPADRLIHVLWCRRWDRRYANPAARISGRALRRRAGMVGSPVAGLPGSSWFSEFGDTAAARHHHA
jgi:hypothetical protein